MSKYQELYYVKEGNKKIKVEKQEVLLFKKDKNIKENSKVVGYCQLTTKKKPNDVGAVLIGALKDEVYVTKKKHGFLRGYIKIGENTYIGVYKHVFIFWFLIALLGILLISTATISFILATDKKPAKDLLPFDEGEDFDKDLGGNGGKDLQELLKNDPGIDFPIYSIKKFVVDENDPTVNLGNPKTNKVDFQYIVQDSSGKEIFKTNLIQPGKAVVWNAKNTLANGEYKLTIITNTYYGEDQVETNGFKTTMNLEVK